MSSRRDGVYFLMHNDRVKDVQNDFVTALTLATRLGLTLWYAEKIETLLPETLPKTRSKTTKHKRRVA